MKSPLKMLRLASMAEAVSYLILLGIAMPLKYLLHQPLAVRIFGSLHGLLFVLLCLALLRAMVGSRLSLGRAAAVFAASFVPFVPFWLDRRMRLWAGELEPTPS
jgi:integral membrane protein